jgi:hypothetical protein
VQTDLKSRAGDMKCDAEFLVSQLTLMKALEVSLNFSRRALAVLDLEGLRQGTQEQVLLSRQLAAVFDGTSHASSGGGGQQPEIAVASQAWHELRITAVRILALLRLQSALLRRSQAKLRVLANMLAGVSVVYGPLPVHGAHNDLIRLVTR